MPVERVEHNELIAIRVPAGDRWSLIDDPEKTVHKSLTDALEAFLHQTGFKGSYRLDPMDSKLYAIQEHEYEVPKDEPKTFSLYGEAPFKQGI